MLLHVDVHQSYTPIYRFHHLMPRPNSYNISYNIIQLWCSMKCCTRLATLLYRVVSCCILLYKVWLLSDKCCTIQHFFCFPGCCMMSYSFGHPMQLCCTLFYSRVSSRSNFPATFLCWLAVGKLKNYFLCKRLCSCSLRLGCAFFNVLTCVRLLVLQSFTSFTIFWWKNQKWKGHFVMVKENLAYLEYFWRNVVSCCTGNVAFVWPPLC